MPCRDNGKPVEFLREDNKYRKGGAVIPADQFLAMLNDRANTILIDL
ncbi:MAG: hypothetical protein NT040_08820 [Bacteroidetes bacterium]|nr:hypothetical protein [Bacteroidota bacterium]